MEPVSTGIIIALLIVSAAETIQSLVQLKLENRKANRELRGRQPEGKRKWWNFSLTRTNVSASMHCLVAVFGPALARSLAKYRNIGVASSDSICR